MQRPLAPLKGIRGFNVVDVLQRRILTSLLRVVLSALEARAGVVQAHIQVEHDHARQQRARGRASDETLEASAHVGELGGGECAGLLAGFTADGAACRSVGGSVILLPS